ncbi:MAG: efflux RND transporter periplasmic adaptor subunit [Planctomycetota bacterium]|jgi:Cu(I)/Ag(I) efflux system membrane fusion protein
MNELIAKTWKTLSKLSQRPKVVLGVVIGIFIGVILHWGLSPAHVAHEEHVVTASGEQTAEAATVWTCSMHPEVRLPKPGLCPKCRMKLIPLRKGVSGEMSGMREFTTSEYAKALMDIETATVERKFVTSIIRMVGKVEYDETRVQYITAWVPGRLDRLYVDYTGVPVKKGDHMVYLYSPELLSAQEELIQAAKAVQNIEASSSELMREVTVGTLEAAREKLRLWGLTAKQISEIEKRGTASDHITIFAPASGIVIHKNAQEGMYVKTGTRIYTVVDLTHVWVKLDAYESDLIWVRYGQEVEFTTVSFPGQVFTGTISFIDPVLNPVTRTVKIRVDVPNADGKLKPEMFVKAVVKAQVATGGKVMDPKLAGKWICPMHPSVVKEEPGKCDICEMPLAQTESLGYVSASPDISERPLVIPVSAALVTGTRAIVYVEKPGKDKPTYEGREVVLGPRAGNYYIVRSGLNEGDMVVTKGNFKIDSALQIQAKPSMMTPEGGGSSIQVNLSAISRNQLNAVLTTSERVANAFKAGELDEVHLGFAKLEKAIKAVDMKLLQGHSHMLWMEASMLLRNDVVEGKEAKTLQAARRVIESLKTNISSLKAKLGLMNTKHAPTRKAVEPAFSKQLKGVFRGYFAMHQALAKDGFKEAAAGITEINKALDSVDMKLLSGERHNIWMKQAGALKKILSDASKAGDIEQLRQGFALLSEQMFILGRQFGPPGKSTLYQLKCPMAFNNRGATWLQQDEETRNPYFGSVMLQCGSVIEVIEPANDKNIGGHQHG